MEQTKENILSTMSPMEQVEWFLERKKDNLGANCQEDAANKTTTDTQ